MNSDETVFGVNFVDGRIKGYPVSDRRTRTDKEYYTIYVRENTEYGENKFVDNKNGTINDEATGLMWMSEDSGNFNIGENSDGALSWEEALTWAEGLEYAGYDDWRLPNAKELQSILDYSRSLDTTNSAAIDPLFETTEIKDEGGNKNYGFYWSSTTHLEKNNQGGAAVYVAFGETLGFMQFPNSSEATLTDVHGAGAQRSDPKTGDASDYPTGHGPQGDVRRITNYVRLVRDIQ